MASCGKFPVVFLLLSGLCSLPRVNITFFYEPSFAMCMNSFVWITQPESGWFGDGLIAAAADKNRNARFITVTWENIHKKSPP